MYPWFLRRLTSLRHSVGATLFPSKDYDEHEFFGEITSAIAEIEYYEVLVNDLVSFYKEFEHEDMILAKNCARTYDISIPEALQKLIHETLESVDRITCVFGEKSAKASKPIHTFMHGYVTWHLCNQRYRMKEMVELLNEGELSERFRKFYEQTQNVGQLPLEQWATPSIEELIEENVLPT